MGGSTVSMDLLHAFTVVVKKFKRTSMIFSLGSAYQLVPRSNYIVSIGYGVNVVMVGVLQCLW